MSSELGCMEAAKNDERRARWHIWVIARMCGEALGLDALDDQCVASLMEIGGEVCLSDDALTRTIAHGVVVGARIRRIDGFH